MVGQVVVYMLMVTSSSALGYAVGQIFELDVNGRPLG